MQTLIGLHYSPWTHKARWALSYARAEHRYREYLPTLGELAMRARLRKWRGRVSVPVLVGDGAPIEGSLAIARWADERTGAGLFPEGLDVVRWTDLSDAALAERRPAILEAVAADPAAQEEALIGTVPRSLQPGFRWLTRSISARTSAKYRDTVRGGAMKRALDELRAALAGGDHLHGGALSFADIAMAVALEMVVPVADDFVRRGPAMRRAWTDPILAREYRDLVEWRDRLCERHRPRRDHG
jgi:glutathione S-transferase